VSTHQSRVYATDAYRIDVEIAADTQNPRIDQAVEHHRCDIDGFLVGYPTTLDHSRLYTQRLRDFGRLRAASVNHHDPHTEVVQDRDLLDEDPSGFRVGEYTAAGLHHKRLALVHPNVRSRAFECADSKTLIASMHDHVIPKPL
jgi:hypothetical protein